jgi:two-component system, NtrC family, response regulator HydG
MNPMSTDVSEIFEPWRHTRNPAMRRVWVYAGKFAPTAYTVLITGESGVGKERVARWLHKASPRSAAPFVAVNCGALPDTLVESELFGHARGAFTGAVQDRPGIVEVAHRGTLFLDEVGDVSAAVQVRLLRVLQEREVRRIGETCVRHVDFRLVAATNRDLRVEVAQQRFREDLYWRLGALTLHVPPLRDRREDLPMLARELLTRAAARATRRIVGFTPRALDRLLQYEWPGNVRELEHVLEHACAVAAGSRIDVEDLPDSVGDPSDAPAVKSLNQTELDHMIATLHRNGGNRRRTAAQLAISVATLRRRLQSVRPDAVRRLEPRD